MSFLRMVGVPTQLGIRFLSQAWLPSQWRDGRPSSCTIALLARGVVVRFEKAEPKANVEPKGVVRVQVRPQS